MGGYIGVAIFFFLSGYGLMESEKKKHLSISQFFSKRVKRVIFPVMLLWIIYAPFYYYFDLNGFADQESYRGLAYVISDTIFAGGWFITAIILLYVAFTIFATLRQRYSDTRALLLLFAMCIPVFILTQYMYGRYTIWSITLFAAGVAASLYPEKKGHIPHSLVWLGLSFLIISAWTIINYNHLPITATICHSIIAAIIIVLTRWTIYFTFPAILGEASFDIYLIHKRLFMAWRSISGSLMNFWIWIFVSAILIYLFVIFRKKIWSLLFDKPQRILV